MNNVRPKQKIGRTLSWFPGSFGEVDDRYSVTAQGVEQSACAVSRIIRGNQHGIRFIAPKHSRGLSGKSPADKDVFHRVTGRSVGFCYAAGDGYEAYRRPRHVAFRYRQVFQRVAGAESGRIAVYSRRRGRVES